MDEAAGAWALAAGLFPRFFHDFQGSSFAFLDPSKREQLSLSHREGVFPPPATPLSFDTVSHSR
jgi:hypothetical protein